MAHLFDASQVSLRDYFQAQDAMAEMSHGFPTSQAGFTQVSVQPPDDELMDDIPASVLPFVGQEEVPMAHELTAISASYTFAQTSGMVFAVGAPLQEEQLQPARRRILRQKTTLTGAEALLYAPRGRDPTMEDPEVSSLQHDQDADDTAQLDDVSARANYVLVYNQCRRLYAGFQAQECAAGRNLEKWPLSWTYLPSEFKLRLHDFWKDRYAERLPEEARRYAREVITSSQPKFAGRPFKEGNPNRLTQVLLTYQGPWGILKTSLQPQHLDVETAVAHCRASAYVQKLWSRALAETEKLGTSIYACHHAISMEVCTATLQKEQVVRVHLHVAFRASTRLKYRSLDTLKLLATRPFLSMETMNRKRMRSTDWSAFYYCCAPKVGMVFQAASSQPHRDFAVNAEWTWALLSQRKMLASAAREELVRTARNLSRHLRNHDVLAEELKALELREIIEGKEKLLRATRRPWRPIQEVTQWLDSFREHCDRRKFLVLSGPSRLGKTQYAVSLVAEGSSLQLNCAGVIHPSLRDFDWKVHKLILFDEGSPMMVARNRRLFQCPNAVVTLGQSPTNSMNYSVYLNDTALVISSNSWVEDLNRLDHGDAEWIRANQILVEVSAPMWTA